MKRVIIDTDPGVDDAIALLLALGSQDIVVEGLTIVMGNHDDMDLLTTNACRILEWSQTKLRIPVYRGEASPLIGPYKELGGKLVHGPHALGSGSFPLPSNLDIIDENVSAADFIIEKCVANPGDIYVITLGPFTNLAKAFQKRPDLGKFIKGIYSMAGVVNDVGNVSPVAEANICNDPEAAKIVFNAENVSITLAPLNVTRTVHMNTAFRTALKETGPLGSRLFDITDHYVEVLSNWGTPVDDIPTHDSTAVMALLHPELFNKSLPIFIDVETKGELTYGQLVADWKNHYKKTPQTTLLQGCLDTEKFKEYMLTAFANLQQRD